MGLEICEQIPDLDACVIPVGGGGLIAGSAVAIKTMYPHVKVIVSILFKYANVDLFTSRDMIPLQKPLLPSTPPPNKE